MSDYVPVFAAAILFITGAELYAQDQIIIKNELVNYCVQIIIAAVLLFLSFQLPEYQLKEAISYVLIYALIRVNGMRDHCLRCKSLIE